MNKNKKYRISDFAENYKICGICSIILAGLSAIFFIMPLLFIWKIGDELFRVWPNVDALVFSEQYAWYALASAIIGIIVYTVALLCSHAMAFRVARNIKKYTMEHLLTLPLGYFEKTTSGTMRRIVHESADRTESYIAHKIPDLACNCVILIIFVIVSFTVDWRLGLAGLVPLIASLVILQTQMYGDRPEKIKKYQDSLDNMSGEATEYVKAMPVVKTFQQSVYSLKRFHESIQNYQNWVLDFTYSMRATMTSNMTLVNLVVPTIIIASIPLLTATTNYAMFLDNIMFYLLFMPLGTVLLMKVMFMGQDRVLAKDALNRVNEILSVEPIPEPQKPTIPQTHNISFKNVSFAYDNSNIDAVSEFNLEIKDGTSVALVGASGSGKTTIGRLVARFWDVRDGSIQIGGIDVKDIGSTATLDSVTLVLQNTHLNKLSIKDNIRFARPDASDDEIMEAVKLARCEDIVAKFPEGLDTMIGSKGVYLSGGETQRLAIARAIVKNSPIVILDEATAFADPENECKINEALKELMKNKTVLIIAHRLSSIKDADEIIVMDKGKIVQKGTHASMVNISGPYSEMWNNYVTSTKWKIKGGITNVE